MDFLKAIDSIEPISLEEMGKVKLMNRVDTKFLTRIDVLSELLASSASDFYIQEIDGKRNMPYFTLYFDTDDHRMYYDHQRGKKSRRKVRIRTYLDSVIDPFLEIKNKNNKGRTKKHRVSMTQGDDILEYAEFISSHCEFSADSLRPRIENRFRRITLVDRDLTERITIDTSLEFHNFASDSRINMGPLAIIEWKRDSLAAASCLKPLLRHLHIHESGFSKYCIGMALTDPRLPHGRINPRLRLINKLIS